MNRTSRLRNTLDTQLSAIRFITGEFVNRNIASFRRQKRFDCRGEIEVWILIRDERFGKVIA